MQRVAPWSLVSCWLCACELAPPQTPPQPEPLPEDTTEVTVTSREPEPEPDPEPEPQEVPEPLKDGVHETTEQTRGRLAPAKIDGVLQAHNAEFSRCYAEAQASNPSLAGQVTLVIVIGLDGSVPHAEAKPAQSPLGEAGVHDCLVRKAKALTFEKPVGGRVVTQYPLSFQPAAGASLPAESSE